MIKAIKYIIILIFLSNCSASKKDTSDNEKLIDIFKHKDSYKDIYVKFYGCHYDIAKLDDNIFRSCKINDLIPFKKVEKRYNKATDKFFDLNL